MKCCFLLQKKDIIYFKLLGRHSNPFECDMMFSYEIVLRIHVCHGTLPGNSVVIGFIPIHASLYARKAFVSKFKGVGVSWEKRKESMYCADFG